MTPEEVVTRASPKSRTKGNTQLKFVLQMKVLLFAGYDTTSSKHVLCSLCIYFNIPFSQLNCAWMSFVSFVTFECSHLQWALVELCRDQDAQNLLREELSQIDGDPTWEQLTNGLPYLDVVVHETLRLHVLLGETSRIVCFYRFSIK